MLTAAFLTSPERCPQWSAALSDSAFSGELGALVDGSQGEGRASGDEGDGVSRLETNLEVIADSIRRPI
jgi:hypothetical protein